MTQCWFAVEVGGRPLGRVHVELFEEVVPRTCENFRALCAGEGLHLEGSRFHRVVRDLMVQGGDITNGDGTGGESIYGARFADESFALKHEPYCLSMANCGPDTNNSRFFITLRKCPRLDGRHVVFGTVTDGREVVDAIGKVAVDRADRPLVDVVIAACGAEPRAPEALLEPVREEPPAEEAEEKEEEEEEEEVPMPTAGTPEERLMRLRLMMNKGRKANSAAVAEEKERRAKERRRGVGALERDRDRATRHAAWKAELEVRGVAEDKTYLLHTATEAARARDRKLAADDRKAAFGWDVFNADALRKAYDKRLDALPRGGNNDDSDEPLAYGQAPPARSEEALDRMVEELDSRAKRRAAFSRRRPDVSEADVDFINDRNKHFNKKIKRAFDKYTTEIRQNLERGTAV
ncbi:hypothetical protein CTAYLR_003023 [Chrysophaeum taylorii]|uniref:peptidylprolyl isomerase n=1 Tax=Chrysophaeum taylorii TaxID=2483200 RepID=A0AAD7U6W0_9STRA|nr:hypothetical protein CTAYLR_003023 [Chrysophaeum taylorii]